MLRIGRYVGTIRNIISRSNDKPSLSNLLKTLSDITNSLYFITDHILLLNKIGAFKFNPNFIKSIGWCSDFFWALECGSNIIYDLLDIRDINNELYSIKKEYINLDSSDSASNKFNNN